MTNDPIVMFNVAIASKTIEPSDVVLAVYKEEIFILISKYREKILEHHDSLPYYCDIVVQPERRLIVKKLSINEHVSKSFLIYERYYNSIKMSTQAEPRELHVLELIYEYYDVNDAKCIVDQSVEDRDGIKVKGLREPGVLVFFESKHAIDLFSKIMKKLTSQTFETLSQVALHKINSALNEPGLSDKRADQLTQHDETFIDNLTVDKYFQIILDGDKETNLLKETLKWYNDHFKMTSLFYSHQIIMDLNVIF
jgi:hypothetical protein